MTDLKLLLFCIVNLSVCAAVYSDDGSDNTLFRTLLNRIEIIEANEGALRVEIEVLKVANEALKKEVDQLHHRANDQEQTIEFFRAQQQSQERTTAKFENVQEVLSTTQTEAVNDDKDDYENSDALENNTIKRSSNRIRRAANEIPVAFFATLTQHLYHVGSGQSIEFDNVVTNVANAYNSHVGLFVAPVDGIYVFSVTLMGNGHHTTHYTVNKNKDAISNIYVYRSGSSESSFESNVRSCAPTRR